MIFDYLVYLSLLLIIIGISVVIFLLSRKKDSQNQVDSTAFVMMQQQLNEMVKTMDSKLSESSSNMREHFGQSVQIIKDVTERLTKLDETNRQVVDFADQLKSLQDILKNPKQRGVLGEYYLETLLKNVLPVGSYQMQYAFKDGTIVDAIVRVKDQIIPIDSKFSLENYNRIVEEQDLTKREQFEKVFVTDLKNRIVETSKYIKPQEGTMDFAFMFIPHEAIYYDLLINRIGTLKDEDTENLIQRAAGKYHVIIVSPTSFLAYLQTVLQGLNALRIESEAQEIRKQVGELGRHLFSYNTYMQKMGNNLDTTVNMYNQAYKEFKKIDKDAARIVSGTSGVEVIELEKTKRLD
jgi:DNA recombination protein RmuC